MQPRKLKLAISTFSYGGNGAFASTHPAVMHYMMKLIHAVKSDHRIQDVVYHDFVDTPITMTRKASVLWARSQHADLLLMIDSDMVPDVHAKEPWAKPFWSTSFDFVYNHYDAGPVAVAAPYCGSPPHENVFAFTWENFESRDPHVRFNLRQLTREEAATRTGIAPMPALPTGLILWDMRVFELTEPIHDGLVDRICQPWLERLASNPTVTSAELRAMVEQIVRERDRAEHSWFYYEYENSANGVCYEHQKCSTEDVTATRDMAIIGELKLGYNPIHINWDAWAGHVKPKTVGKPSFMPSNVCNEKLRRAVLGGVRVNERIADLSTPGWETLDWTHAHVIKGSDHEHGIDSCVGDPIAAV